MRTITLFNDNWVLIRQDVGAQAAPHSAGEPVTLPHTWNAQDGQDGGGDYYRGTCWYVKRFSRPVTATDEQVWLEFRGAAMTAGVWLNGRRLARHEGGYSTFRVELTLALEAENVLAVSVDNSPGRTVYPQKADFTFYGGLYRDVYLLTVPKAHFALDNHGGPGLRVTPVLDGRRAELRLEAEVEQADGKTVRFTVADGGTAEAVAADGIARAVISMENVRLWDGTNDPYLYTACASLDSGDMVSASFGCRTFAVDPRRGFLLNGRPYRLCGAARHQDRQGVGNALTPEMHEEDMALMREMGCSTVRLAHYQHDQYFYDLCDRYGMIVWAEIPYITEHMPEGRDNTISQMTELILQNYNHLSIVCWGLSNEITAGGVTEDLVENHRVLNELCHRLDPGRLTTMAHVFLLDPDDPLVTLPDVRSYNLYYGWYVGEPEQNDQWFDEFHRKHPDAAIGLSEYGADANPAYQSARPRKGDWSEGYQCLYHEHMIQMWLERPYIWAMHVWNMFDFGADGRDEGGKPGQNQKGLVTFDRRTKKDAFYLYKAYLSRQPFVHICGGRYVDRPEAETEVKVYSNQPRVALYVDGKPFAEQEGEHIFRFRVPITGRHTIEARAGEHTSSIQVRRVEEPNPDYRKPGTEDVTNWFETELPAPEGRFSIQDAMGEVNAHPEAGPVLNRLIAPLQEKALAAYGDVAKSVQIPESMQKMMDRMSVEATLKQLGGLVTPEVLREINAALNQISKAG